MAYIGKQPEFTQYPSKFFDGDGTAMTVTLDYAPPNDAALLVFISGVRQDTSAYNCTGTSLTFTGSVPSGTANVQVVHMGLTVDVGAPGDDTVTTAKIQDDAVTAAKLANSINTEIAANTAKVTNATHTGDVTGATALTIATDAVDIAMLSATGTADATTFLRGDNAWATAGGDNTPSFFVTGSGNQAIANETWTKVAWSTTSATEEWDTDSAFASDKFTVPSGEAGKYLFSFGGLMDEMDTNESWNMDLYVNGSEHTGGNSLGRVQVRSFNTNLGTFGNSTIALDLAVADYVEVYFYHNEGGTNNLQLNRSFFQGFKLIGV